MQPLPQQSIALVVIPFLFFCGFDSIEIVFYFYFFVYLIPSCVVLYVLSDTDMPCGIEEIHFHVFGCMLIYLRMVLGVQKLLNIFFYFLWWVLNVCGISSLFVLQ